LLGPAEKHEPLTIASYGVGACGVALAVFLGTRGRSVEEVLDELEDK
jgi:hypothetical protein